MSTTIIYSRHDYEEIEERIFDNHSVLCTETLSMINDLTDQVSAPTYSKTPTFPVSSVSATSTEKEKTYNTITSGSSKYASDSGNQSSSHSHLINNTHTHSHRGRVSGGAHNHYSKGGNSYRKGGHSSQQEDTNKTELKWRGSKPSFQPTKLQRNKEGHGGIVDNVRLLLNKLTDKTYDKISEQIIEIVDNVQDEELKESLTNQVISVACTNNINSRSYSRLLHELKDMLCINEGGVLDHHIEKYTESYKVLSEEPPSPDNDYDKFCEMNLSNNIRRGTTQFYCYLTELGLISQSTFIGMISTLTTMLHENKDMSSAISLNEELAENLFVLSKNIINTDCKDSKLGNEDLRSCILGFDLSPYISKKIGGVSQKAKFKLMDINDIIKKSK